MKLSTTQSLTQDKLATTRPTTRRNTGRITVTQTADEMIAAWEDHLKKVSEKSLTF